MMSPRQLIIILDTSRREVPGEPGVYAAPSHLPPVGSSSSWEKGHCQPCPPSGPSIKVSYSQLGPQPLLKQLGHLGDWN